MTQTITEPDVLAQETRVALVIGNGAYESSPLANPVNDANLMERKLRAVGFDVILKTDANVDQMDRALGEFGDLLDGVRGRPVGLFYYAGHGVQSGGVNYLIPVGANIRDESHLRRKALSADEILEKMARVVGKEGVSIMVLDACRDNPLARSTRSGARGLAPMKEPEGGGALIAYAAAAGKTAADGYGANSPFTEELASRISQPGLSILDLLVEVGREVTRRTRGEQEPAFYSTMGDHFWFVPGVDPVPVPVPDGEAAGVPDPVRVNEGASAAAMWEVVKDSGARADLEEFIRIHSKSPYAQAAMMRLKQLERVPFVVETNPQGASVELLDGSEAYQAGMRLSPGEYRVRVSAEGHESREVALRHGRGAMHRIELESLLPAVDGEAAGVPDPVRVDEGAKAAAMWEVVKDSGARADLEEFIRIYPSSPYEEAARMRLRQLDRVPFVVETNPQGASVELLDGSEAYQAGMRLSPGEYRVRVSAEGHESREVALRHGRGATHRIELESLLPAVGERFRDCDFCPEMVVIPAGLFRMGCLSDDDECGGDEKPVREVQIPQPFALSKHEVTFGEWDACVASGGCNGYRPEDRGWGRGLHPVINVSWDDARAYASWLSEETGEWYRLPSESEWEYAARAGTVTKYSWGNEIGRNRANCDGCGSRWDNDRTAPVGSFPANAFGLHDMHGNVWEWVEDCWNGSYRGAPTRGEPWTSGDCGMRVLRGGSWYYKPRDLRSAYRLRSTSSVRRDFLGFRVARTLTP